MPERRPKEEDARPSAQEAWRQFFDANEQAWTKAMKEMYEANEQIWTKAMKDVTTTQWFAEAQGKMLESFLAFQKMLREGTTAQLNALNLPTRDELARIGELVVGLEEKIDQIDDRESELEERLGRLFDERLVKFEKSLSRQFNDQLAKFENVLIRRLDEVISNSRDSSKTGRENEK
jgi:polyhydroxyalkanoic acid synthase PhaR subunit